MPARPSGEDVFFRLSGHVDRDAVRDLLFFLERTPLPGSCEYRIDCATLIGAPPDLFSILAARSHTGDGDRGCIRLEGLSEPLLTALTLAGFSILTRGAKQGEGAVADAAQGGALPGHPEEARNRIAQLEVAVAAINSQGRVLFVNKAFERVLGCSERQVRGQNVSALLQTSGEGDVGAKVAALFARAQTGDAVICGLKTWAVRRERCPHALRAAALPLREANWPARTILCLVPDLGAEETEAAEAEAPRVEMPGVLGRNVPISLFRIRFDDGRLVDCTDRFATLFGYESREDALANFSFGDHLAPFTELQVLLQLLARKREIEEERLFLTRDAERFWGRIVVRVNADDSQTADGALLAIDDLKRTERELRESEERCARLMDSDSAFTYTVRVRKGQTISVRASKGCEAFTGFTSEDFASNPLLIVAVVHDNDKPLLLEQVRQILTGSQVAPVSYRMIHRDATVRWVRSSAVSSFDVTGEVARYDVLVEDVTENRRLKDELRQAEKMEAVGQLTGGIAHDFNNLLTGILGNLSLAEIDAPETIRPSLAEAQRAGERAVGLVRQLLSFSRKSPSVIEAVNMASIIAEVAEIARNTFDRQIEIRTDVPKDLHTVLGDPIRMHQVLLNLCLNARDAVDEIMRVETARADFHIRIAARNVKIDANAAKTHPHAHAGHFVEISVSDNGIGMNVDVRERMFEPFFTTKSNERGTGLGLATVRSIVEQHQGWIEVESKPHQGATFRFLLPRALHKESPTPVPLDSRQMPVGSETVLVIDDERMIRDMLRNILGRLGYNVLLAADGIEGTEIYRSQAKEIDLVILDMSMPALSGGEVLRQLRSINPAVRVVVSSGYTTLRVDGEDNLWQDVDILAKPYRPARLAQTVRQALDKPLQMAE